MHAVGLLLIMRETTPLTCRLSRCIGGDARLLRLLERGTTVTDWFGRLACSAECMGSSLAETVTV